MQTIHAFNVFFSILQVPGLKQHQRKERTSDFIFQHIFLFRVRSGKLRGEKSREYSDALLKTPPDANQQGPRIDALIRDEKEKTDEKLIEPLSLPSLPRFFLPFFPPSLSPSIPPCLPPSHWLGIRFS